MLTIEQYTQNIFCLTIEIKDFNFIINGYNVFVQPVKLNLRTYDSIQKIATGQGDDYTTGFLLDYTYFKNYYKVIATNVSKEEALDAYPKAIPEIVFIQNLENIATLFFIIEEAKSNSSGFF